MKKISLLLAVIMLFSAFSVGVYSKEELPTIYSVVKTENNTVELTLSISEGSNIGGCSFNIVYDSEKLTYVNHEVQETIALTVNMVNPNYNANAVRVLWAGTEELTAGGEIIKVSFTINDGASGSTDIVIDKLKMMDTDSQPVDCTSETATIEFSKDETSSENTGSTPSGGNTTGGENTGSTPSGGNTTGGEDAGNAPSGGNTTGGENTGNAPSGGNTTGGENTGNAPSSDNTAGSEDSESGSLETTAPTPSEDGTDDSEEEPDNPADVEDEGDIEVFLLEFSDVRKSDWYFESVRFARYHKLMNGVSETEFAPLSNLTRGMFVTILHRLSGEPECGEPAFTDVEKGLWYSNGIAWTAENKVVSGIGDNKFAPNSDITREQIALIMYNYSKLNGFDTTESKALGIFNDAASVSDWAKDAVEWAVGAGLLNGKGDGILDPKGNATRAEIAAVLMRYTQKYNSVK